LSHERELPGEGVAEPFSNAALLLVRIESPYVASATWDSAAQPTGELLIRCSKACWLVGVHQGAACCAACPHTWLLAQARERRVPHHRLGHYARFSAEDLERWLAETRIESSLAPGPR